MEPKTGFRQAEQRDLVSLVNLLADDALGRTREDTSEPLNPNYQRVFEAIDKDPNNELIVAESSGSIVGVFQLTFTPTLSRLGSWRCTIEGVRISSTCRGQGLGEECIRWAINRASEKGCSLVQLTSDKQRPAAIKFYQSLGFEASHEGLKRRLS